MKEAKHKDETRKNIVRLRSQHFERTSPPKKCASAPVMCTIRLQITQHEVYNKAARKQRNQQCMSAAQWVIIGNSGLCQEQFSASLFYHTAAVIICLINIMEIGMNLNNIFLALLRLFDLIIRTVLHLLSFCFPENTYSQDTM